MARRHKHPAGERASDASLLPRDRRPGRGETVEIYGFHAVLAALAAVQLIAGGAAPSASRAGSGTLCLDPLGENRGAVCRSFGASRIDPRPDICQCLNGDLQVDAPYCGRGEAPQIPTHAFKLARREAALRDGTLVGKTYAGRSYCIAPPRA